MKNHHTGLLGVQLLDTGKNAMQRDHALGGKETLKPLRDYACRIDGGRALITPGPPRVRLWPDAAGLLGLLFIFYLRFTNKGPDYGWGSLMGARSQLHVLEDLCDEQHDAMQEWLDSLREQPMSSFAADEQLALTRRDQIEGDAVIVVASGGNVDLEMFEQALNTLKP